MLLGIHTYSFYMHGLGQAWAGFRLPWPRQLSTVELFDRLTDLGLDGVQLDDAVLERLDPAYVRSIGAAAKARGLFLEYNFSMDMGRNGIGRQHEIRDAIETARLLGADVLKVGLDLNRPRPLAASRFHPAVTARLKHAAQQITAAEPHLAAAGIKLAVENHCDTFAEEIIWLLDRVASPHVGACIDTVNALMVTEDPMRAVAQLAPRAFTNHFKDHRIVPQRYGCKVQGTALGEGDIDLQRACDLIKTLSPTRRIIIETEMDIPTDDKAAALAMEMDTVRRSIRYCREVLKIQVEPDERTNRPAESRIS